MCGIAGFIGKDITKIDKRALLLLGIANDSRGGDSCGIFPDGKYEKGIGTEKLFEKFYLKSKIWKKLNNAQNVLIHDRKASVKLS